MASDLQKSIFHDDEKAREWLEARVWRDGRVCPHCGAIEARTRKLEGKAHRPGLYQCNDCREQFSVTVGTIMERSKLPLSKWLMAMYLLSASKKGMSAHQLSRMLGVSYKSSTVSACSTAYVSKKPAQPPKTLSRTIAVSSGHGTIVTQKPATRYTRPLVVSTSPT